MPDTTTPTAAEVMGWIPWDYPPVFEFDIYERVRPPLVQGGDHYSYIGRSFA